MKKVILTLRFYLILFASVFAQQVELLTPKVIDLGRVLEGSVVEKSIRFVNSGDKPVKIKHVKTSCGCTVARIERMEYTPGDTAEIFFSLNTRGFHGVVRKSLTLYFEHDDLPKARFIIQAHVYTQFEVTPRYIRFQDVKLNADTVITEILTFQNRSDNAIHVTSIHSDSDLIRVFPRSMVIPPGDESSARVELRPLSGVRRTVYVVIETDYKNEPHVNIPVFIDTKE